MLPFIFNGIEPKPYGIAWYEGTFFDLYVQNNFSVVGVITTESLNSSSIETDSLHVNGDIAAVNIDLTGDALITGKIGPTGSQLKWKALTGILSGASPATIELAGDLLEINNDTILGVNFLMKTNWSPPFWIPPAQDVSIPGNYAIIIQESAGTMILKVSYDVGYTSGVSPYRIVVYYS